MPSSVLSVIIRKRLAEQLRNRPTDSLAAVDEMRCGFPARSFYVR